MRLDFKEAVIEGVLKKFDCEKNLFSLFPLSINYNFVHTKANFDTFTSLGSK